MRVKRRTWRYLGEFPESGAFEGTRVQVNPGHEDWSLEQKLERAIETMRRVLVYRTQFERVRASGFSGTEVRVLNFRDQQAHMTSGQLMDHLRRIGCFSAEDEEWFKTQMEWMLHAGATKGQILDGDPLRMKSFWD